MENLLRVVGIELVRARVEPVEFAVDPHERPGPGLEVQIRAAALDHALKGRDEVEHLGSLIGCREPQRNPHWTTRHVQLAFTRTVEVGHDLCWPRMRRRRFERRRGLTTNSARPRLFVRLAFDVMPRPLMTTRTFEARFPPRRTVTITRARRLTRRRRRLGVTRRQDFAVAVAPTSLSSGSGRPAGTACAVATSSGSSATLQMRTASMSPE